MSNSTHPATHTLAFYSVSGVLWENWVSQFLFVYKWRVAKLGKLHRQWGQRLTKTLTAPDSNLHPIDMKFEGLATQPMYIYHLRSRFRGRNFDFSEEVWNYGKVKLSMVWWKFPFSEGRIPILWTQNFHFVSTEFWLSLPRAPQIFWVPICISWVQKLYLFFFFVQDLHFVSIEFPISECRILKRLTSQSLVSPA